MFKPDVQGSLFKPNGQRFWHQCLFKPNGQRFRFKPNGQRFQPQVVGRRNLLLGALWAPTQIEWCLGEFGAPTEVPRSSSNLGGRPNFAKKLQNFRSRQNCAQKVPAEGVGGGQHPSFDWENDRSKHVGKRRGSQGGSPGPGSQRRLPKCFDGSFFRSNRIAS